MLGSAQGLVLSLISSENSDRPMRSSEKRSPRGRTASAASSPSTVCRIRRHSPVIVTPGAETHELAQGRPSIIVPRKVSTTRPSSDGKRYSSGTSPAHLAPRASLERESNVAMGQSRARYLNDPPPLRLDAWMEPPGSSFMVRGPSYLDDREKVASEPSYFTLLTADLVKSTEPILGGLCAHPKERIQQALARERATGANELPEFIFAVNLLVPGYHMISYFGCDNINGLKNPTTGFERTANQFFFGESDAFRDQSFKVR